MTRGQRGKIRLIIAGRLAIDWLKLIGFLGIGIEFPKPCLAMLLSADKINKTPNLFACILDTPVLVQQGGTTWQAEMIKEGVVTIFEPERRRHWL